MNKKAITKDLLLELILGLLILLAILTLIFPSSREYIVSRITSFLSILKFRGAG